MVGLSLDVNWNTFRFCEWLVTTVSHVQIDNDVLDLAEEEQADKVADLCTMAAANCNVIVSQ